MREKMFLFLLKKPPVKRSVHRDKRAKDIPREAVNRLEKENRAKILPLAKKEKAPNLG